MKVTCWEVHGIGEVVHGLAFASSNAAYKCHGCKVAVPTLIDRS